MQSPSFVQYQQQLPAAVTVVEWAVRSKSAIIAVGIATAVSTAAVNTLTVVEWGNE